LVGKGQFEESKLCETFRGITEGGGRVFVRRKRGFGGDKGLMAMKKKLGIHAEKKKGRRSLDAGLFRNDRLKINEEQGGEGEGVQLGTTRCGAL